MEEQIVDGLTYAQVKYNVFAFRRDTERYEKKASRTRKPHTRAYWEQRAQFEREMLAVNESRLAQFTTA